MDEPVEYVFNTIHTLLLQYFCTNEDLTVLGNHIDRVIAWLTNFKNYFLCVQLLPAN